MFLTSKSTICEICQRANMCLSPDYVLGDFERGLLRRSSSSKSQEGLSIVVPGFLHVVFEGTVFCRAGPVDSVSSLDLVPGLTSLFRWEQSTARGRSTCCSKMLWTSPLPSCAGSSSAILSQARAGMGLSVGADSSLPVGGKESSEYPHGQLGTIGVRR